MEPTATPLTLHFLVLSLLRRNQNQKNSTRTFSLQNILRTVDHNTTPALFPALVRAVSSAVKKSASSSSLSSCPTNCQGIYDELSNIVRNRISKYNTTTSSASILALLLGTKQLFVSSNGTSSVLALLPQVILQQTEKSILHHALEVITNTLRDDLYELKLKHDENHEEGTVSENRSHNFSNNCKNVTIARNSITAIAKRLNELHHNRSKMTSEYERKENENFVQNYVLSPNSTVQIFLNVLECCLPSSSSASSSSSSLVDENLIELVSSSPSKSSLSLSDDDLELVKSELSRSISRKVFKMLSTNSSSSSSSSWEASARLVSQAWTLEGAPPQEMMMNMLSSSSSLVTSIDKSVIAQWEKHYRQMCPIPSPSLLAAFLKAKQKKNNN